MSGVSTAISEKVRTTVRLPRKLYDEACRVVDKNLVSAETLNDFFIAAVFAYLKMARRKQIDALFLSIAEDADYQKEAKLIAEEFSQSDWEALELEEKSSTEV
jgi:hypothetical protein